MLIQCVECGREISDKAAACPGCGAPIASGTGAKAEAVAVPSGDSVQTIEQTSKKWKGLQLAGSLAIALGIVFMFAGSMGLGAFLGFIGILAYIYGRAGGWWHNG